MPRIGKAYVFKSKGKWRAKMRIGGKQVTATTPYACSPSTNKNKQLAESWAARWRDEQVMACKAKGADKPDPAMAVEDFCGLYVEMLIATEAASPGTTEAYARYLRMYVRGTDIGGARMVDVDAAMVEAWKAYLMTKMASTTANHVYMFLSGAFNEAMKQDVVLRNPLRLVRSPKIVRKPKNVLNVAGRDRLLRDMDRRGRGSMEVAATIAIKTGLGPGEVCGLRWLDIGLDDGLLHVQHAIKYAKGRGDYFADMPKNSYRRRTIPIGPKLVAYLQAWKEQLMRRAEAFDVEWTETNFVLGSPLTGSFYSTDCLNEDWRGYRKEHQLVGSQGLPLQFYDLRHTFATIAIASGADVEAVSKIMGHSSVTMTLDQYGDALPESKKRMMLVMDA